MLTVGVVESLNQNRIAIWVEAQGGYTVVKVHSCGQIEPGDVICWQSRYSTGPCIYWNATKECGAEVNVQDHDVPIDLLRQQLFA